MMECGQLRARYSRGGSCWRRPATDSAPRRLHTLLGDSGERRPRSRAFPNFAPRAKRVIFLFQAGGPSHLDLLDYKPEMKGRFDQDIPPSVFGGQRVTGMVAQQDRFPGRPHDVRLPAAWAERHVAERTAAAHRQDRRRDLRAAGDEHGGDQSRSGDHVHADRAASCRAGRAWAHGSTTDSAARTRICRRSWC